MPDQQDHRSARQVKRELRNLAHVQRLTAREVLARAQQAYLAWLASATIWVARGTGLAPRSRLVLG